MTRIKTVFHVHTDHSDDCDNSVEQLLDRARAAGVGCLAITDHDTIAGARAMAAAAPAGLRVIVGEEISTDAGHLIGLFLREEIPPGLSPRAAAEAIRAQGGLVVVPHPFNRIFGCGLCENLYDILDLIDAVEVNNSQNLSPLPDWRARRFAEYFGYPAIVGVDLHHGPDLDACHLQIEPFETPTEFLAALERASLARGRHRLGYFARSAWYVLCRRLGLALPERFGAKCRLHRRRYRFQPARTVASGHGA